MNPPAEKGATLVGLARTAIQRGLASGKRPSPSECLPAAVRSGPLFHLGASFVTLHLEEKLRGCMGSLESDEPLYKNVTLNAYRAAFCDPRFAPLRSEEMRGLSIHVSVLSPLEPLRFGNENELLQLLRPGHDGLLIRDGARQATFLPSVWEQLREPERFLSELKRKARLPLDRPLPALEAYRYSTRSFSE